MIYYVFNENELITLSCSNFVGISDVGLRNFAHKLHINMDQGNLYKQNRLLKKNCPSIYYENCILTSCQNISEDCFILFIFSLKTMKEELLQRSK